VSAAAAAAAREVGLLAALEFVYSIHLTAEKRIPAS